MNLGHRIGSIAVLALLARAAVASPATDVCPPSPMDPLAALAAALAEIIDVRFSESDGVEFKTADLARADGDNVQSLATADRDGNGWVTANEVLSTQGLSGSTYFLHEDLMNVARRRHFAAVSVAGLRAKLAAGGSVTTPRPARLGRANADLSARPRSAFVPLANHLASRLASAKSYASIYGDGDDIFHTEVGDLWRGHSRHELFAALSILAAREGGMEFGLSRSADGRIHLVQGAPEKLELDADETGLDLIIHTHPRSGADGARPSQGDFFAASEYDPDHLGSVVSDDGWFAKYTSVGGNDADSPRLLWNDAR